MNIAETLLCEETVNVSPSNDKTGSLSRIHFADEKADTTGGLFIKFATNEDEALSCLLEKESSYMPGEGYLVALQLQGLCDARSTAVQWILKVRNSYGFQPLTVALAVNYFDRYLSKQQSKPWKAWMIQLLSIACLSIAAKMEEISVPLLVDLQIDGLKHIFEAKTIQRMELAVLGSLDWHMSSVTVFSYVDELIYRLDINGRLRKSVFIRVTELLLGSMQEVDFLEFRPSLIILSAVRCALEEIAPLQTETLSKFLAKLFPVKRVHLDTCSRLMEELVADPVCPLISSSHIFGTPASPATIAHVPLKENPWDDATQNCSDRSCVRRPANVPIVRCSRKRKLDNRRKRNHGCEKLS